MKGWRISESYPYEDDQQKYDKIWYCAWHMSSGIKRKLKSELDMHTSTFCF